MKIYKNKGNVRGENFPTFLLSFNANGKRQLRRFMDSSKASAEATRIAEQKPKARWVLPHGVPQTACRLNRPLFAGQG